jgi:hypothetical protein
MPATWALAGAAAVEALADELLIPPESASARVLPPSEAAQPATAPPAKAAKVIPEEQLRA